jgi:aminoglycoside phosphotransferase (APT) family kinase protein
MTSIKTPSELLAAAARENLHLHVDGGPAEFDKSGLDFLVVHARDAQGTPWIVRTPRRADVVAAMHVEARVLALVRPALASVGVAVPHWRVCADDVVAYPRLDGTPVVTVDAERGPTWNIVQREAPPEAFLASLARALAALQRLDTSGTSGTSGRSGTSGTSGTSGSSGAQVPAQSIDAARAELARSIEATRAVLEPSAAVLARWQRWLDDDSMWPTFTALVHGDLHPGHMLVDATGTVTGVLDWTEAKVTDPSVDLAMFHGCFGAPVLDALLAHFERAGGRTWPKLRAHAAERWSAFAVAAAEFAIKTNDDGVLAHAKAHLAAL